MQVAKAMPNKLHCNGCLKGPLRGVDAVVSVMTVRRKGLIQITDCRGLERSPWRSEGVCQASGCA